jgi:hypothetical protein
MGHAATLPPKILLMEIAYILRQVKSQPIMRQEAHKKRKLRLRYWSQRILRWLHNQVAIGVNYQRVFHGRKNQTLISRETTQYLMLWLSEMVRMATFTEPSQS